MVTKILYYKTGYFQINFSHFLHPYTNTYILIPIYPTLWQRGDDGIQRVSLKGGRKGHR